MTSRKNTFLPTSDSLFYQPYPTLGSYHVAQEAPSFAVEMIGTEEIVPFPGYRLKMAKLPFPALATATQFPSLVIEKWRGERPPEALSCMKVSFASGATLKAAMESWVLLTCVLSERLET